jgi:protein-L-isoaspartate(D-aspartate) O-methyltransferase
MASLLRPQRLLAHAQRDAQRMQKPVGLGLDSSAVRERMVARLKGAPDDPVLLAMARVPRHRFVDPAFAPQAYEDTSLPIGFGQTISKPSVVARMLQLLWQSRAAKANTSGNTNLGRVLEIGTGCGYQAAVLACLATRLVSIERIKGLHQAACARLEPWVAEAGLTLNYKLLHGDGMLGVAASAPYDCIVAAAGGEALPEHWLQQLAPGGRLVAPVAAQAQGQQQLLVVDHSVRDGQSRFEPQRLETVSFVPLKSGFL